MTFDLKQCVSIRSNLEAVWPTDQDMHVFGSIPGQTEGPGPSCYEIKALLNNFPPGVNKVFTYSLSHCVALYLTYEKLLQKQSKNMHVQHGRLSVWL